MKTKLMLLFTSILLVGCSLNSKTSTNSSSDSETKKLAAPVITLNNSTLTWDEVTNATSYRIYENGEIKYNQIVKTQYEINVTDPGTYVYAVVAFNKYNLYEESDKSNEVTYTYAKPVDLVAPVITIKDKVVSWNKVNTATTYNIYSNGEFLIEVSQTSYTLNFTEVGGYNIQVQAKRGDDVSPLSNMVVYKNTTGLIVNTNSSWNRTGLYDEWTRTGDFDTGVGEGFDMKAGASAFVYHSITNETKFMKVSIRVFHRDGETYPKFYVYIDGMIVREQEASEDWVTTESDNPTDFVYDLSNYVGQDVFIKFYEAAATHCCITSVALLEKTGAQLSENTSWSTKDEFFSDWYTSSVSSTINEGPDFAGSGVAKLS